jgi:RNA polymerase sigma factor (TIGR02999 family)
MDGPHAPGEITTNLALAAAGDAAARDRAWAAVYGELRRLASRRLDGEAQGHTLSTTDLVHEAYLKLAGGNGLAVGSRQHFLALAARAMRQILVDHARHRARKKRGGGQVPLTLHEARDGALNVETDPETLLALDRALSDLSMARERLASVVELRFFGGLDSREIGEILGVTRRTVERDWQRARAYLYQSLFESGEGLQS